MAETCFMNELKRLFNGENFVSGHIIYYVCYFLYVPIYVFQTF